MKTQNQTFTDWFNQSLLLKAGLIGMLTLLLLIPSNWIQSLILERQSRQDEVVKEISDKWSGTQLLQGPVMVLPYKTTISWKDATGKLNVREAVTSIYLLPETLNITSKTSPEILHRGIFDAVVYNTKLSATGKFSALELKKSGINPGMIQWDKARIAIGLSDLKGLKNNPSIKIGTIVSQVEPDFTLPLFRNSLTIQPDLSAAKNTTLDFNFDLDFRGSSELNFLHTGKNTTVTMEGSWNNPSFTGRYLPEDRNISTTGFTATWKLSYFNRPFPQQWIEKEVADTTNIFNKETRNASFGVKFLLPVDQYQKTMRSAKYAILIILLTFVSLFFTEFINKRKVHLLQYVLVGAAMIIYYTLLLAFSEQVGFNKAYLIASTATAALITAFIFMLLKSWKPALVFGSILTIFYGFIFVIIQLQDLALLVGSIGLFIVVAILMYLSAKMDWNRKEITELIN
ncbi:cell envelope integrity protein CreD [Pedobacter sp. BS3]|uniref:cell envelope integrity protein CreD n=1 Tax=Pedobacter sp. BS3 TaxID=2567937 RepID=UPI0011EE3DE8|nr:cell envelope integrity protein CreD [Pedobacter sp. BS3]TZF84780.1 cell envelope integrity protein CreD [Pedobacter sp. BS3]